MSYKVLPLHVCLAMLLFFPIHESKSQNPKIDSLKSLLNERTLSDSSKMIVLGNIARSSLVVEDKLQYADQLLEIAGKHNHNRSIIRAYLSKGTAYRLKGDLKHSLENLFKAAQTAIDNDLHNLIIEAYSELSITYTSNKKFRTAISYNKKAIEILRKHGSEKQLAINLLNVGFSYYTLEEYDSALLLYGEAKPIFDRINLAIGQAYTIGNRALVYWKQGKYDQAEKDLLIALALLEKLNNGYALSDYNNQLANVYLDQNKVEKTILYASKALKHAKALKLKEQIRDASLLLAKMYQAKNKFKEALEYQSQYFAYKDSIDNVAQIKSMESLRADFEINLKEKEIDLLENQKELRETYIMIGFVLLLLTIILLLFFRQRFLNTRLIALNERKQHSEKIKDLLSTQESKALQSMIIGRDNERKRIAQEIHNHLGSLLATIKVNINGIDEEDSEKYQTIVTLVDQACSDVRSMSHSLNMGISKDFGLVPAVQELVDHIKKSRGLEVEFGASMDESELEPAYEIMVYRIIQELVSNVLKHAQASRIEIILTYFEEEQMLNIMVNDNGKGFNEEDMEKEESPGMGIHSLQEMVASYQGDIKFDSNKTSGTTVNIDLPTSKTLMTR